MFKKLKPAKSFEFDDPHTENFKALREQVQLIMQSWYPELPKTGQSKYKQTLEEQLELSRDEIDDLMIDHTFFEDMLENGGLGFVPGDLELDQPVQNVVGFNTLTPTTRYLMGLTQQNFTLTARQYRSALMKQIQDKAKEIEELVRKMEIYRALSDINRLTIVAQKKRVRKWIHIMARVAV